MKKLAPLILFSLFFIVPQFQNDIENIPREGDETQYWEIGYGIYNDGEYKREIINGNDDENLKLELGYRRGEPIYPFIVASIFKIHNFSNEVPIENCNSFNCFVFDEEVRSLVILANLLKLIIVIVVYKNLRNRFSSKLSLPLALTLLLLLPIEYKDLITILLLTLGIHFYFNKKVLSLIIFSLLPLSNAVFLYVLPVTFLVYFFYKSIKFKNSVVTILILLLPSLIWMTRNYLTFEEFSISGRAAEVLSIRAEYSTNSFEQIRAGFIYYTPGRPSIFGAIQGRLWSSVTSSGSEIVYDRSNPMSSYKKAKKLTGVVGDRFNSLDYETKSYIEKQKLLNQISLELIRENLTKHALLSAVFGYRGMFPSINFDFIEFYSFPNGISNTVKEIFSFLRLFFIPYSLIFSIFNLLNRKMSLASLFLIILWVFYSSLTHFIPRYSTVLIIPAILFLANIEKEEL